MRKVTSSGTTLFSYDVDGNLVEERRTWTAPISVRDYVWLESDPVGLVDSGSGSPTFSWVHTDYLGMPIAVTNTPATGNAKTIWRANYAPFGQAGVFPDPDGDGQQFALALRFPGQYSDDESIYHYNWHRYYDPSIGRYISADPIGQAGGVNVFTYASNNPLGNIDSMGLSELEFNRSTGSLTVYPGDGQGGRAQGPGLSFDASNNARSGVSPSLPGGNGPAPNGTFPTQPMVPTPGGPESALGDKGFVRIDLRPTDANGNVLIGPARDGVGIHAGRVGMCDAAGRCGARHATQGCIRTTPEGMDALASDPPTRITIK